MWKNSRADLKDRKLDLEFNYNTRLCLPGHGSTLQGLVSLSLPSHCSPPLLAGTSTCLAQLSSPPPHGLLHSPSGSQSESTQSTESQMQYWCWYQFELYNTRTRVGVASSDLLPVVVTLRPAVPGRHHHLPAPALLPGPARLAALILGGPLR